MVQHAPLLPQQHMPLQPQLPWASNVAARKHLLSMAPRHGLAMATCSGRAVPAVPEADRSMGTLVVKVWKLGMGLRHGWKGRRKTHGSSAPLRSITDFQHLPMDVQGAAGGWVSLFAMWELALADPTLSALVASVNLKKVQLGINDCEQEVLLVGSQGSRML